MRGKAAVFRAGLLPAVLLLAQCHDGDRKPGAPAGEVDIVDAFPQLGFDAPLAFMQAPGDARRAFVATQGGVVYAFDFDSAATVASPFLDIDALVTDAGGEMGLLGLAFDPGFAA